MVEIHNLQSAIPKVQKSGYRYVGIVDLNCKILTYGQLQLQPPTTSRFFNLL